MDIFRLTYFNCSKYTESKWDATYRHEIYGSGEAICDMYRNLIRIGEITDGSVPRFIEIYNKDGVNLTEEYKRKGNPGVIYKTCNTFN
jgi:hypothetical protein